VGRSYLGNDLSKVKAEDLGRPVTEERLVEAVALLGAKKKASGTVLKVLRSVEEFLASDVHRGRDLGKQLILSLLLDCVTSEMPMDNREKEERRKFRKTYSPELGIKMVNVVPAKSHFRSELYWTLMFETGSSAERPRKDRRFIDRMEASEQVAAWLVDLGVQIGGRGSVSWTKSQARCGKRVASAATSIRAAYRRWNVYQAPDKPVGVYLGGIRILNGKRVRKLSRSAKVIAEHQW
jgi:hypothetical protein